MQALCEQIEAVHDVQNMACLTYALYHIAKKATDLQWPRVKLALDAVDQRNGINRSTMQ